MFKNVVLDNIHFVCKESKCMKGNLLNFYHAIIGNEDRLFNDTFRTVVQKQFLKVYRYENFEKGERLLCLGFCYNKSLCRVLWLTKMREWHGLVWDGLYEVAKTHRLLDCVLFNGPNFKLLDLIFIQWTVLWQVILQLILKIELDKMI